MGNGTLAETIESITRKHLDKGNFLFGSNITAVGRVNGTVPLHDNVVELPNSDVAGAGIAVGAALVGRPIFILRFQDFLMLNGSPIFNYAAKSLELHGKPCPIFIRAISSEGLGCCHSGSFHSIAMHYPGIKVVAPVTPEEYEWCYNDFMQGDKPYFVSEHRDTYNLNCGLDGFYQDKAKITIFAVSATRIESYKAVERLNCEGIPCNLWHIYYLKPFLSPSYPKCKTILITDTGFETCGASEHIAYKLSRLGYKTHILGLKDETKTLLNNNPYPMADMIYQKVKEILGKD